MLSKETIDVHDLPHYLIKQSQEPRYCLCATDKPNSLAEGEKATLVKALETNNWHIQNTADTLGINRTTLWRKMKRYDLSNHKNLGQ